MKSPKTLIKERESNLSPTAKVRLYTYIRPRSNGEATIEIWVAKNAMKRKSKKLAIKCVFKFKTNKDKYEVRDTVEYHAWSSLAQDHLIYDFSELGYDDYFARAYCKEDKGVWMHEYLTSNRMLPIYGSMLNDFTNTKYKYCGFNPNCGMPLMTYLALWREFPQAEIMSKSGNYQLLDRKFLSRLKNDKDFAKYVGKNHFGISDHRMHRALIERLYRKGINANQYAQYLRNEQERIDAIREANELAKMEQYEKQIQELYERIKHICGYYGAYEVVCPKSVKEMRDEGKAMHNCIGTCYPRSQGKYDICLFLHKDGKPCVDIRIDAKTFKIMEVRAICNKDADESAWEVAKELSVKLSLVA